MNIKLQKRRVTGAGKQPSLDDAENLLFEMERGKQDNETFQVG